MIWGLVPAKLSSKAKGRLGRILPPAARGALARAMLTDVVRALTACPRLDRVAVISRDPAVAQMARQLGALPIDERHAHDLNSAVEEGLEQIGLLGGTGALVAMGDIPLVTPHEVAHLIEATPPLGVALAPSRDGTGTNLVSTDRIGLIAPRFGPGSLALHHADAAAAGVPAVDVPLAGASLDIDTPDDLLRLMATADRPCAARRVLAQVDLYATAAPHV